MCLAKVYLSKNGQNDLILEDVNLLQTKRGKLHIRTVFGEQKELWATIKEVDFQHSSIVLENPPQRKIK
jgi:predicted RNA-binding protein